MLLKKNRVTKKDMEEMFKRGSSVFSANLNLRFLLNSTEKEPKIAFIVPKTVSKKAIIRNRLRRRGYQIIQEKLSSLPKKMKMVFIFGKNSSKIFTETGKKGRLSLKKLEEEINFFISKLQIR